MIDRTDNAPAADNVHGVPRPLRSFILEKDEDPSVKTSGLKGAAFVVTCGLLLWARIIIIGDPPRSALASPEPMPIEDTSTSENANDVDAPSIDPESPQTARLEE